MKNRCLKEFAEITVKMQKLEEELYAIWFRNKNLNNLMNHMHAVDLHHRLSALYTDIRMNSFYLGIKNERLFKWEYSKDSCGNYWSAQWRDHRLTISNSTDDEFHDGMVKYLFFYKNKDGSENPLDGSVCLWLPQRDDDFAKHIVEEYAVRFIK